MVAGNKARGLAQRGDRSIVSLELCSCLEQAWQGLAHTGSLQAEPSPCECSHITPSPLNTEQNEVIKITIKAHSKNNKIWKEQCGQSTKRRSVVLSETEDVNSREEGKERVKLWMGINKCCFHSSVQQEKKQTCGSEQKHFVMSHVHIPAKPKESLQWEWCQCCWWKALGMIRKRASDVSRSQAWRGIHACHNTIKLFPWSRAVYPDTELKRGSVRGGNYPPSLMEIYFYLVRNILIFTYIPWL